MGERRLHAVGGRRSHKIREEQWPPHKGDCPNCKARLQWHVLTAWCLSCGWALNREHAPGKPT